MQPVRVSPFPDWFVQPMVKTIENHIPWQLALTGLGIFDVHGPCAPRFFTMLVALLLVQLLPF